MSAFMDEEGPLFRAALQACEDLIVPASAQDSSSQLRGVRAQAYKAQTHKRQTSRVMRKMLFRARPELSIEAGLVQLDTEEDRLLRLLD